MFDFNLTKDKVIFFIPNFGRGHYIRALANQFKTKADPKDYLIVIGNDGTDDNFDDLAHLNVKWFTLKRVPTERNGAFIRNYFIARCQGTFLYQKDPEILLTSSGGDIIYEAVRCAQHGYDLIRPTWTASLEIAESNQLLDSPWESYNNFIPPENTIKSIPSFDAERIHFFFGTKVEYLVGINGYSEDFLFYGPEDKDLFGRLKLLHLPISSVNQWCATHLYHPVTEKVYENLLTMHKVYEAGLSINPVKKQEWGNG
jgi:hypothetical protein